MTKVESTSSVKPPVKMPTMLEFVKKHMDEIIDPKTKKVHPTGMVDLFKGILMIHKNMEGKFNQSEQHWLRLMNENNELRAKIAKLEANQCNCKSKTKEGKA